MVNKFYFRLILLVLFPMMAMAADPPKITAELDQSQNLVENQPLKVSIMVTHDQKLQVDDNSFKIKGKPITVEHTRDVPIGTDEIISIYNYNLPGVQKGLHLLDEVTVKVGGKKYTSVSSTYEILGPARAPSVPGAAAAPARQSAAAITAAPSAPIVATLKLEQGVDAPNPLYPGKRARFVYRYIYSGDIELSKETLPLMEATGFIKIGEEEIKDSVQGDKSIRDIIQTVEAVKPGDYKFAGGVLEGKAYVEQSPGRRTYAPTPLHSDTPEITVTVKPLPTQDKPASFTGAVGQFQFKVFSLSPKDVNVGDKVVLAIDITGKSDVLANVHLPDLCCQPGMSGLFKLSDLPPVSVVTGSTKRFTVEMRPLSAIVKEIPSLEFSYFDPTSQKFKTVHSDPIPLTVHEIKTDGPANQNPVPQSEQMTSEVPQPIIPDAIQIGANDELASQDLHNKLFGTWSVYWLIPFGIALILSALNFKKYWLQSRNKVKVKSADDYFNEAMKISPESPVFYQDINRAFLLKLAERKDIPSADITTDQLPEKGLPGEVRQFLSDLEERRFAGKREPLDVQKARILYEKLRGKS